MNIDIPGIAKSFWSAVDANSPAILTAISVTGTISTAVLASRASFQASEAIYWEENKSATEGHQKLPLKGRALLVWTFYIPTGLVAASTIAAIIAANSISSKRTTALVTAMTLTEKAYVEYQQKVSEHITAPKEQKIRDEIAQDHINAKPPVSNQVIVTGGGKVICFDALTGRYFESSAETIRRAENTINKQILDEGHASQNDFYNEIGLERIPQGDDLGWSTDALVDIAITSCLTPDEKPALHISFKDNPISKFYRIH